MSYDVFPTCCAFRPRASQLLPLGQDVLRHQPENWPFNVLRALYLRSDSEDPRSEHSTSGVTLERSDPRRKVFFLRRGGVGCSKESVAARTPSCATWSLDLSTCSFAVVVLPSVRGYYVTNLAGREFVVPCHFFCLPSSTCDDKSLCRLSGLHFLRVTAHAWFRVSFNEQARRRLEGVERAFDHRPGVAWLNRTDRTCFPLHRVSSWRPVDEECSSAADIRALEKIPGPSRDVPKSDGDHVAPTTSGLRPTEETDVVAHA